jgi:hypothetical protein
VRKVVSDTCSTALATPRTLDDGPLRLGYTIPDDGVDLDRNVVAGNALLLLDRSSYGAQV